VDAEKVKTLKDHLEALEKTRALEKECKTRLQREGLSPDEQQKWASVLAEASLTIGALERAMVDVLKGLREAAK
jgi:hypothetical protein